MSTVPDMYKAIIFSVTTSSIANRRTSNHPAAITFASNEAALEGLRRIVDAVSWCIRRDDFCRTDADACHVYGIVRRATVVTAWTSREYGCCATCMLRLPSNHACRPGR